MTIDRLLHIYDASEYGIRATAWARRHADLMSVVTVYPVAVDDGWRGLRKALDDLVSDGQTFARALFETHGNAGAIYFDGERVDAGLLNRQFVNRGYEKLFPYLWSRIYFNGCDIADRGAGWDFLDAAGRIFLRLGGGVTFAQTDPGRLLFPWSTLTGHVIHFAADTCYSSFGPGGRLISHSTK